MIESKDFRKGIHSLEWYVLSKFIVLLILLEDKQLFKVEVTFCFKIDILWIFDKLLCCFIKVCIHKKLYQVKEQSFHFWLILMFPVSYLLTFFYREYKKMIMEIEDLLNKLKAIQMLKVSRDLQEVSLSFCDI